PLLLVPLIQAVGWRSMFAVLGIVGMLISIPLVWFFVQDHPAEAKQLSSTELAYIQEGQETLFQQGTTGQSTTEQGMTGQGKTEQGTSEQGKTEQSMTQTGYRRDRRFWVATLAGSLNAFCGFGILNWLPTYFNRAKGINFEQLGWPLALVFAAGIVGIFLMAYLGDKFQHRILLASLGFAIAAIMVYIASNATSMGWLVLFFALAVLFQSAYAAQEYAIVQRLLPADRVGAGTGLYNGLTILLGGVGGSLIPGSIVAATGNFNAGMFSIVVGGMLAALVLLGLGRIMRY
ncbi:MAG TPA: MFS transporter, partial [Allocoleopsis sp.]